MKLHKFKQARLELSLSQTELAEKLGLGKGGQSYISKIETGLKIPSNRLIKALCLIVSLERK